MEKRGQLLGQPLIMIFGLIVGALILVWGFYQVYKVVNVAREVEVADYINTLKRDVQRYYYFEVGSSNQFRVSLPSDFTYICFVNSSIPLLGNSVRPPNFNPGFVANRKNDNVFVYSQKDIFAYYVPSLRPPDAKNPTCVKNGMPIVLISKGTHVEVTNV